LIWIPLATASSFFLWHLAALAGKGEKMNHQMARLKRFRSEFEANRAHFVLQKNSEIPDLAEALKGRKNFLDSRAKKRAAKQRRLVERMQLKERE
jgi:hypothetical protein